MIMRKKMETNLSVDPSMVMSKITQLSIEKEHKKMPS